MFRGSQRGGLWEIETAGKPRAFLAKKPVEKNRVTSTVKKPVTAESVVKKPVKVVEVDLGESDDERAEIHNLAGNGLICEVVRAAPTVAAAAAGEGARARGRVGRTDSKTGARIQNQARKRRFLK